ncbi:hypothetical protein TWF694_005053 [Orbilia ellipsospora]|uniref:Clr5 domain-containing protein n=1 Tax=Orbilia ellipsospora TaxID=2528407 RepID=A0AAV9WUJ8_9PEZI
MRSKVVKLRKGGPASSEYMSSRLVKRKPRAPRCARLDEPHIRTQIELLYVVLQWNIKNIRMEINASYGLNATTNQYRDRLHKWGCRQRANNYEYRAIYQQLVAREEPGKESEVKIGGIIIPKARIEQWISRNITFTEKMIPHGTKSHIVA